MSTMASASGTGRGRNNTELMMVKSAVLTPMQTESVSITIAAKRQSLKTERALCRMSGSSVSIILYYAQNVVWGCKKMKESGPRKGSIKKITQAGSTYLSFARLRAAAA